MSTTQNTVGDNQMTTNRRDQVMIGDLPSDFLRLDGSTTTSASTDAPPPIQQNQIASDARVAQVLQAQQAAGYAATPSNVAGRLSITVVQAKLAKNYGLVKMDPYCRVRVGHGVIETHTDSSGAKNPRWQKTMQCYLPLGVDSIYMEIYDECAFSSDARIAWAHVTIPSGVFSGETVDDWFSLSGRQGDDKEGMVNLIMSFVPVENLPPQTFMYPQPMVIPVVPQMYYPGIIPPAVNTLGPAVPSQQQQIPLYTEEDITQAKDMFPAMEEDVIKSVFEANSGNKNAAINSLLSMNSA